MTVDHAWLPRTVCDDGCLRAGAGDAGRPLTVALRTAVRVLAVACLAPALPLLAVPLPGHSHLQRLYCRLVLRAFGVRISVSGGPIRNLSGVLVVSPHVSWMDIFAIGALLPGSFVAKAELVRWPVLGALSRIMKVIPIDRTSLRRLPDVVGAVAARLRAGHTVVAFPEGTTWCGLASGSFRPAMFQAAVDAARPVQPLRLSYQHRDGRPSTVPAFVGEDTLLGSMRRIITARVTVCHLRVESLQLPGADRRDLAARCESVIRDTTTHRTHALAA